MYVLQRHLIPFKAHFESSLVLTYALPAPVLQQYLARDWFSIHTKTWGFWR